MPRQQELILEFVRERNVFDNADSRVIVGDCLLHADDGSKETTIKGEANQGALRAGLTYRFYGHWHNHPRFGEQFIFAAFTVETPATEDAVVAYLQQCTGIGPSIARRLWDNYGSNAIAALRLNPDKCADEVKGLKPETAKKASEFLQKLEGVERVKTDLLGLLSGRGFPKRTVDEAIKRWGSDAAVAIRNNPYLLMAFRGCGFLKTDKMWQELRLPPDKLKRQALCAWHAIARDSEGHTWHPLSVAQGAIRQRISGTSKVDRRGRPVVNPERATELAVRSSMLTRSSWLGCDWISEGKKAWAEERVARAVFVAEAESVDWPPIGQLAADGLSEHQAQELSKALGGVIGLLTGSPGTGKTFTAAAVIRAITRLFGDSVVAVCAPTGKAAVRLTEAMSANGISIPAVTIHRLLGVMSSSDGWSFWHNSERPLPFRFIFVDETSMVDTDLMASLLDARAPGTHVLFLGDPNQLAPVGHGAPLRDMITAGVPCGELREIRRNSGRIVRACAEIRDNRRFVPSPQLDMENGENLLHVETKGPDETIERLQQFIASVKNGGKFDPVWGVQVLVAVNKKSPLSRQPMNLMLQGLLNPGGERANGNKFRKGDKIINLKNGEFVLEPDFLQMLRDSATSKEEQLPEGGEVFETSTGSLVVSNGKAAVANGEIGEAISVEPARTICRLTSPDRVVVIFHGKGGKNSDDEADEDDKVAPSRRDEDDDDDTGTGSTWDLAYAISTHKSQGSEFPIVVTLVDEHAGAQRLCTRNWIYTALSRAKALCVTIGKRRLVDAMCQKDGLKRRTFLAERIGELQGKPVGKVAVSQPVVSSPVITVSEEQFQSLFTGLGVRA